MLKICAAIFKEKAYSSRIPLILFRRADIISRVMKMIIDDLLKKRNMTRYRLAVQSGVPHTTLNDICSGKTKLEKCSAETIYKLAKTLNVPMELLTENGLRATAREQSFEYGLPAYFLYERYVSARYDLILRPAYEIDMVQFYASHLFYSFDDFAKQLAARQRQYNNFPMCPLNWKSPRDVLFFPTL